MRVRIRLRGGRGVGGQRGPQVAEPGHRDDPKAAPDQWIGNLKALVEPATGPMHCQDRRAVAGRPVFDRAAGCLDDSAAGRDPLARPMNVATVAGQGARGEPARDKARENGGCPPPTRWWHVIPHAVRCSPSRSPAARDGREMSRRGVHVDRTVGARTVPHLAAQKQ